MGRDGPLYEFAQWYPRMVVYDDVRGWNVDQYLGQGEFYLEYGDIDYRVTVPGGLHGRRERRARRTRRGADERRAGSPGAGGARHGGRRRSSRRKKLRAAKKRSVPGTKTWHFRAQNVRDVAWGAAPDFRWDAAWTGPLPDARLGALCQSYYEEPKAGREWEHVAENTQWTIRTYSAPDRCVSVSPSFLGRRPGTPVWNTRCW